ncbi:MAG TPA: hypothetical protein VHA12_00225 [Candidatus Nanoarchaeia archaeon]|nr:hypothetical protein [Candidatus Nanoarchaeia archaeon]
MKKGKGESFASKYIEYLKDNPQGYWFKRKIYGWGWTPVTWQGWIVIILFISVLIINGLYFENKVISNGNPSEFDLGLFFGSIILSVFLVIAICYAKCEKPKWSWGL